MSIEVARPPHVAECWIEQTSFCSYGRKQDQKTQASYSTDGQVLFRCVDPWVVGDISGT